VLPIDDDRTGAGFFEMGQRRLAAEHRRHHVDLEAAAPRFLVHAHRQRADIGDKDVDTAERRGGFADPLLQRREIGDVDRAARSFDAFLLERGDGFGDRPGAARAQRDVATFLGELFDDGPADAACAAGD
jgi:hypothetical protein